MSSDSKIKRASERFPADPNTLAWIITDLSSDDFRQGHVALVINEADSGCGLIVLNGADYIVGQSYRMLVGRMAPQNGIVRWKREIESGVFRVGIEFTV